MDSELNSNLNFGDDSLMSAEIRLKKYNDLASGQRDGLVDSKFGLHAPNMIKKGLLPRDVGIPFRSQKHISRIYVFKIKLKYRRIRRNIL